MMEPVILYSARALLESAPTAGWAASILCYPDPLARVCEDYPRRIGRKHGCRKEKKSALQKRRKRGFSYDSFFLSVRGNGNRGESCGQCGQNYKHERATSETCG